MSEEVLFQCDVREEEQSIPPVLAKIAAESESLRLAVINQRELLSLTLYQIIMRQEFSDMLSLLAYACEHPTRRKRTPVDAMKMVETWVPLIRKLAVAHDIDEKDEASSSLDDALVPIISAPVGEIRLFYRTLIERLKDDPTIPWAIWRLFEFWGKNVLDKITKDEELKLKTELATRIAQNSIALIPRSDWVESMVGALQWRSPERLEEINAAIDAGEKPRVRGKESCLFLQVGEKEVML